jgi:hypothetical protein
MSHNRPPEEERFAANALNLANAILYAVNKLNEKGYKSIDPNTIALGIAVIQTFNKHDLIQGFIKNSHKKCWDKIKERDEQFFIENACHIFEYLPTDSITLFKELYMTKDKHGNNIITQELKNEIWSNFDSMIKISIQYVYKNKLPELKHVDVQHHAKNWAVKL